MRKNKQSIAIVHVNKYDIQGGAAKSTSRLANIQRHLGHQSNMLVAFKETNSENVVTFQSEPEPSIKDVCRTYGQLFYEFQGSHKLIDHPLVQSADILHLQNLHSDYFNPFSISALT